MPIHTISSKQQLDGLLQKYPGLVLLKFGAKWCGPCKTMAPIFQTLSDKHTDCLFLQVDADELPKVMDDYNVSSLPYFAFIKHRKVVSTLVGAVQMSVLDGAIATQKRK